jgi:hypothetical protein
MKIHNKHVDSNIPGRKVIQTPKQNKNAMVMGSPIDVGQKDQGGQDFLNMSPGSSPPHSMAMSRLYPDRAETQPFIPNAADPLNIPPAPTLGGHGILLTTQESELGGVASSSLPPPNSLSVVPSTTTQAPHGSSYMYMWPYIHTQQHQDQNGSSSQFF